MLTFGMRITERSITHVTETDRAFRGRVDEPENLKFSERVLYKILVKRCIFKAYKVKFINLQKKYQLH